MWSAHRVEHKAANKRNEALMHVPTWVKLKESVLSEISQSQ